MSLSSPTDMQVLLPVPIVAVLGLFHSPNLDWYIIARPKVLQVL